MPTYWYSVKRNDVAPAHIRVRVRHTGDRRSESRMIN
jgi:hypothetical protein